MENIFEVLSPAGDLESFKVAIKSGLMRFILVLINSMQE